MIVRRLIFPWLTFSPDALFRHLHLAFSSFSSYYGRVEDSGVAVQAGNDEGNSNKCSFASLLRECGNAKDLSTGKRIHERILRAGHDSNRFLKNLLIEMYGKCGSLDDAHAVFNGMHERNVFSWNIIIAAYAQNGHPRLSLQLFRQMELDGLKPSEVTFVSIISSCSELEALREGRLIHARVEASGFESHVVVGTSLINMYGKCGCLDDASEVFNRMPTKNVVSWTTMITVYTQNGQCSEALQIYKQMEPEPNEVTFVSVIEACANAGALAEGKAIHARILESGLETEIVGNALVNMYGKLGSLDDARAVFDKQPRRNVVWWNVLIAAYTKKGHSSEGLELYQRMQQECVKPNRVTFLEVLAACSLAVDLTQGKAIHADMLKYGFDTDDVLSSALVTMYGKCGSLDCARSMFDKIQKRNVVSWTTMVAAYAQHGHGKEALQLYHNMDAEGIRPNELTFISALNACSSVGALAQGKTIHERILRHGYRPDGMLGNALVDMYGKCSSLEDARQVFDSMFLRSVVAWTAMIAAYAQHGCRDEAFQLFREMDSASLEPSKITFVSVLEACSRSRDLEDGKKIHAAIVASGLESDVFVGSALISMYSKCGSLDDAKTAFDRISQPNVVSWNAMIAVYVQHGYAKKALELYHKMDVEPDKITFFAALDACANLAEVAEGRAIHARISASGYDSDVTVGNALIHMYGNCGNLGDAVLTFETTQHKDVASWNAITGVHAKHGLARESLGFFRQMELEGFKADIASLTGILFACSHAGLKHQGWQLFMSMREDHGIAQTPEHFGCMVDILGRAGQVQEAEDLINSMPFEPGFVTWMALLGACSTHGDLERGVIAAQHVFMLNEKNATSHILLSNMYAAVGMWAEAKRIRKLMEDRGLKNEAGWSSLDHDKSRGMPAQSSSTAELNKLEGLKLQELVSKD